MELMFFSCKAHELQRPIFQKQKIQRPNKEVEFPTPTPWGKCVLKYKIGKSWVTIHTNKLFSKEDTI